MNFNIRKLNYLETKEIQYLRNTLLIPFKSLNFRFEMSCDFGQPTNCILSVEVMGITYTTNIIKPIYMRNTLDKSHFAELLVELLYDMEQIVLNTKVIIPSKSGDYYDIINRMFNSKYYDLSIN